MVELKKMPPKSIDFWDLLLFLVKRWMWLLLATLIGIAVALVYYYYTVTPSYKASAEIYMTDTGTVVSFQEIQLSSALTEDYKEIILSRNVLKAVIKDQNLNMSYTDLKDMISVTTPKDSHCMIISTTASSPQEALNITNSLLEYGIDQIYRILGKDQPSVIDSAEPDAIDIIQASWKSYAYYGAGIALAAVVLFFVIQFLLDTTLKSDEDIEKYLGLNVLAVIPEATVNNKA